MENINRGNLHGGPLQVSRETQFALMSLSRMVVEGGTAKTRTIISEENIPPLDLEYVFGLLQEAKIIELTSNEIEEYKLCISPDKISLKMIIEAVDGTMDLALCINNDCSISDRCKRINLWKAMDGIFKSKFEKITLSQIAKKYGN